MPGAVVGRDQELEAAAAFLDRMAEGPSGLLLEGDAGAGKTTLWLDAIRQAEARGCRVLRARPVEAELKLSYAALADLLGGVVDEVAARLPPPQERALAAVLVRVPESEETVQARMTAVALVSVLGALAADEPVLVAVDDVQWLDAASERALAFAARRMHTHVGVLLTRRGAGDDVPLDLDRALPEGGLERRVVGPLSLAALHHVLRARLGTSFPRPLLTRVAAASEGNPFVALEIGRAVIAQGADRALSDPLPVPLAVRRLSEVRIRNLSCAAQEVLLVTSALFRPTVSTVAGVTEGDARAVEAAVAEAVEADVLADERGRLRFTHPLFASAVYASASDTVRRQLHQRLAAATDDLEERARHLAQAATGADESVAAEIAGGATEAARRGAQDAAAELFEASRRLTPPDRADERAWRTLGQASALNAVGDFADARSLAQEALECARADAPRVAALSLLGTLAWFGGSAGEARRGLEQALMAAGEEAALTRPLYAKLVRFSLTLDPASALRYAEAAVPLLREGDDRSLLAHVLLDGFFASAAIGRPAPPADLEGALDLEERSVVGHDPPHPYPLIWFVANDDLELARARYLREDEWYRQRGEEIWRADRRSHLAIAELRAGNGATAQSLVEEACAALEHVEVGGPFAMVFEKRALVDAFCGRADRARDSLLQLIDGFERKAEPWWTALSLSTLAVAEFAAGELSAADDTLTRMHALASSLGVVDVLTDRSEPFHVELLLELGEIDRARQVLQRLEERARRLPRLWIATALPSTRALVSAADGDVAGALALADRLDTAQAGRLPFALGCHLLVKGRLLRRARQKRAAADALAEARDIFERLGTPAWSARAQVESERIGLRRAAPRGLTESERRVAQLVATGLTNRQVAERLFISPKTVEANLGRAYAKLGIRSRAELGARLADLARPTET